MKTKLLSFLGSIALAIAAVAQTTTLTVNTTTGKINVPTGVTPYFDVLDVAGVPVPIYNTPQKYGAIADGASHPVSEWLTGGAHDRGYANLAAIQADYPHVVSLNDESDWAAAKKAVDNNKTVFFPSGPGYVFGNTNSSHALAVTEDSGQMILGSGRYDPSDAKTPATGTRIIAGPGTDGVRFSFASANIRDLTVQGAKVSIASVASTGGAQAVITTSSAHGLPTGPVISGGWTITGNTVGAHPVIATSAAHGLTSGDWVKISGSTETAINGFFRVTICDAAGALIHNPNSTATHFRIAEADGTEVTTASNGGACSFVRVYEVAVGPSYGTAGVVTGATPEIIGEYHVTATGSTTLALYTTANTSIVMSVNADANTGQLYTTRRGVSFGDDNGYNNGAGDQDSGRHFLASNLMIRECTVGFFGGSSDGGAKGDHITTVYCGTGIWMDGNIDKAKFDACWVTSSIFSGYRVGRNGGALLDGSGGADNARTIYMTDGGCHLHAVGPYFEGIQRNTFGDGSINYLVDANYNTATFEGLKFAGGDASTVHFNVAGTFLNPSGFIGVYNSPPGGLFPPYWNCNQNGGSVMADPISRVKVNQYNYMTYEAGNYEAIGWDNALPSAADYVPGHQFLVVKVAPTKVTEPGMYTCFNLSGSNEWVRTGFDTLPVARGGTGTTTPSLVAGTNVTVTGTWPNQTIASSGSVGATYGASRSTTLNLYTSGGGGAYVDGSFHDEPVLQFASIPVGDYTVRVTLYFGAGSGDTGLKWQLAGSATFTGDSDFTYIGNTLSPPAQALISNIVSGDSFVPSVSAVWLMSYEGVIHVTSAGSVKLQIGTPTAGDSGQLRPGSRVDLIKH